MGHIWNLKNRGRGEDVLESFKVLLLKLCPDPMFSFLNEQVEGSDNIGKVWDELPVNVCKPCK